jgi:polar amino acid transport system substrate-binding protein
MLGWNWKKTFALMATATIAAVTAITPAKAVTLQDIKTKGTLVVGTLVDYPPFGLLDSNGQATGYDPDLAKEFADGLGVKLQILPVTSANRVQYLLSGQVDLLIASLGITDERLKVVDFSQPYSGSELAVYGDKSVSVADAAGLAGQTIGVTRGTIQDTAVTAVAPPAANIQRYDDDASSAQALLSGQVPLLGVADLSIAQINKIAPDRFDKKFVLRQQTQGIAVRKDSPELLAAVNDLLDKKKKDGSLGKLYEQWMKAPLPAFVEKAQK